MSRKRRSLIRPRAVPAPDPEPSADVGEAPAAPAPSPEALEAAAGVDEAVAAARDVGPVPADAPPPPVAPVVNPAPLEPPPLPELTTAESAPPPRPPIDVPDPAPLLPEPVPVETPEPAPLEVPPEPAIAPPASLSEPPADEPPPMPEAFPDVPADLHAVPMEPPATDDEPVASVLAPDEVGGPLPDDPEQTQETEAGSPPGPPLSMERDVEGTSPDQSYSVPHVPETLRRFDAVATSDSFAGSVESMARAPHAPAPPPEPTESPIPDMSFAPKTTPPVTKRQEPPSSVPWLAVAAGVLLAVVAVAVMVLVVGVPGPSSGPEATAEVAGDLTPVALPDEAPEGPARAPATPGIATLQVRSNKTALVFVDGEPVGLTPVTLELPPGTHTIGSMQPGQPATRKTQRTTVEGGTEREIDFTF